jgi:hypothetical protein
MENQSVFPAYVTSFSKSTFIVPGQGRWKQFTSDGFDYAFAGGMISAQVLPNLNIQAGHGKLKIGHGYRSLFISDNSFNYPYVRITQQWFRGRLQYTNLYAQLSNLVSAAKKISPHTERLFQRKAAAFQYLSYNAGSKLSVGLFQGLVWEPADERNLQQLDLSYVNPIIFTNAIYYGLNGKRNIITGAEIKVRVLKQMELYGQVMADRFGNDSTTTEGGCQTGMKWYRSFGVKNLFMQAEYNIVTDSAYTHQASTVTRQSYYHYNQPLAFTPGSGSEYLMILAYRLTWCVPTKS